MIKITSVFINLIGIVIAAMPALFLPCEVYAGPYIEGHVLCAGNGLPLDSVRVASSLFAAVTLTEGDGRFALERGEYRSCQPETLITGSFDEYRVKIASVNNRFFVDGNEEGPGAASLLDLRGRLLQKGVFRQSAREAIGPFYIGHFRDFHNAAPDIFLGFEGMPGHHKNPVRGSYGQRPGEPRLRTWGGADYYMATVGGLWDALLGEGRHIRTIVNSDFHSTVADFWPGEYAKTRVAVTGGDARAWLEGMRSGEIFIAHGDLISELAFSIDDGIRSVSTGGELTTAAKELQLTIRFKSPATNNHGDTVRVDHVDLIAGSVTGLIDPSDPAYTSPVNPTTTAVRRFTADDWTIEDGWRIISMKIPVTHSTYFRLRGTNLGVPTPGEVDEDGNPLMDEDNINTEAIAWKDLWFYSNPIFVYRR